MKSVDGSIGGGQILRNTLAYAAITGEPVEVQNIRQARPKPGLRAQHLMCCNAIAEINGGELNGAAISSDKIAFLPKPSTLEAEDVTYRFKINTAGSITLLLQAIIPVVLLQKNRHSKILCTGGTDVDFAPPIDYFRFVFSPIISKIGMGEIHTTVLKRGYYPRGGGIAEVVVSPINDHISINFTDPGVIKNVTAKVYGNNCLNVVKLLNKKADVQVEASPGPHKGVLIIAETLNGCIVSGSDSTIHNPKISDEELVNSAWDRMMYNSKYGVDEYMQDQLILFMALATKSCSMRACNPITDHTASAIKLAEQMTETRFEITVIGDDSVIIQTKK